MEELIRFFRTHERAVAHSWFCIWVGASLIHRSIKGFSMKPQGTVLFHERFGSGKSSRNWLTRMAGASKCLLVTVTESELLVRPWLPFNLFFLPEIYDLEHRIPTSSISAINERTGMLGTEFVDIDFVTIAGKPRRLSLVLVEKKAFLTALRANLRVAA